MTRWSNADLRLSRSPASAATAPPCPESVPLPLQQHPAYGQAVTGPRTGAEMRWITGPDGPLARMLVLHRALPRPLRLATVFRGPVWLTPPDWLTPLTAAERGQVIDRLTPDRARWRWRFFLLMAGEADPAPYARAGFWRVMTGASTAWLDLSPPLDTLRAGLAGNWRNQLRRAESANLSIDPGGRRPASYAWLLDKEAARQQSGLYRALPPAFVARYAAAFPDPRQAVLSVTARQSRDTVAGALFLLHGTSATYHIGWSGPTGRACHAQNRVLWAAITALKARGVRWLDMGGLDTVSGAGIARFKLGTGARPVTLAGTFA
ncbi:GNAT family N-acetyltransferase [Yunchengibacter salinarum]|uniref:GNAT family N-acetyltransferase n=1 Tax=Yunchengibacter salinarum TaxID=3133399 RepID=UPI0035B5E3D0